jgi:ornithine decarboxylase
MLLDVSTHAHLVYDIYFSLVSCSYGSRYDGQNPTYKVVRSPLLPRVSSAEESTSYPSTLWGPTCDSADVLYKDHMLPQLRNGDWLLFPNAGAYTHAGACDFNG